MGNETNREERSSDRDFVQGDSVVGTELEDARCIFSVRTSGSGPGGKKVSIRGLSPHYVVIPNAFLVPGSMQ